LVASKNNPLAEEAAPRYLFGHDQFDEHR